MDYNSGVSIPALAIGLCSIEGEGGEGGAGGGEGEVLVGAAAALGEGGAGGGGTGEGGDGGEGAGGEADWLEQFSAEGGDAENPSNRDWLKAKGFKTADDVAKSYREAEKAIHSKGGITVPGEGAKPEEIAAFNKAIGVPEKVDGYEFSLPEGVTQEQLDMDLITPLRGLALEAGVPAKGFAALAEGVIKHQLDELQRERTEEDGDRDAKFKEWGGQKDAKRADVDRAMRALNMQPKDFQAIQRGFRAEYGTGSARALDLFQKLGAGLSEDTLLGGDGPRRFGVTGAEAQAEIDKLTVDKEFGEKMLKKDPDAVARWDRLNAAVAAEKDREARAAAAG